MKSPGMVKCPSCKKEGRWFEGAYGLFCSRRCKLVDLGKWFGEEHAISEPLTADHLAEGQSPSSRSEATEDDERRR